MREICLCPQPKPNRKLKPLSLTFQDLLFRLQAFLGGAGMRAAAALRRGSGRRHHVPGDVSARAGAQALQGGLRAALAAAGRRTLRRESQPAFQAHAVPTDSEAAAGECAGAVSRIARSHGHRPEAPRSEIRRRQLGVARGRRVGRGLAGDAGWTGDYAVHLLPAVRRDWISIPFAPS